MNKILKLALCLSVGVLSLTSTQPGKEPRQKARLIMAYLPEYRLADYAVKEIEKRGAAQRLTHIIYSQKNRKIC